jgi:hypothetical protein
MAQDPAGLLEIAGIETPLIGFYDVSDASPFDPLVESKGCVFVHYSDWLQGKSLVLSEGSCRCRGGSYWIGGVEFATRDSFASGLNEREGFKACNELMRQWLDHQKPYLIERKVIVIGPLRDGQVEFLKTVTFLVNPDQLSLLLLGTEYHNPSPDAHPAFTAFGSGCGQLAALFGDLEAEEPRAIIGATDIAMRVHLPPDILALTVNRPMYRQLCELDEDSFLYKSFWARLRAAREEGGWQAQDDDRGQEIRRRRRLWRRARGL